MPDTETYSAGALPPVVITAENLLKKKLLNLPGEVYHKNPAYFRAAMKYMRRIGDKEAERRIFMKSFNYGRQEASKKVLLLMGGVVAVGCAPAIAANAGTFALAGKVVRMGKVALDMYKATTYWRMGINAGTQAIVSKDGWWEIDYVSVASEAFNPLAGVASAAIEWRPFHEKHDQRFRSVFYNKTISETIFDMGTSAAIGGANSKISSFVKKNIRNDMNVKLINRLLNNVAFPVYHSGFSLSTEILKEGTKKKYKIGKDGATE